MFHVKHFFIEMHIYKCYNETNKEGNEDYNEQNYSNGKNSGIKLEVTASDADSITLNVTVPQVQGSGTKDDPFLVSSVDD